MEKTLLVVVQLGNTAVERLQRVAPALIAALDKLSVMKPEPAFHSAPRDIVAYVIRTKLSARRILTFLETPMTAKEQYEDIIIAPFLSNDDGILVLELGQEFIAGRGFTRLGGWLQHHNRQK